MQTVTLKRSGVSATRLGFGTAGLLREPSKRRRLDVLAAVLDAGIRHFDTAPIYGLGEAERLLGEFLATRSEPVTIATKFGLAVNTAAARLAPVQSIARAALKAMPGLRRLIKRRAGQFYRASQFDAGSTRASLERSLAALRRGHVDMFLMHECAPETVQDPALLDCLEELRAGGRIRSFGTATPFDRTLAMLASHGAYCAVVQFDSDVLTQNVARLPASFEGGVVTHSVLTRALAELAPALKTDADLCSRWKSALDADVGDATVLSRLLLQAAIQANPSGIVLVHSNSVHHIAANAAAAEAKPDAAQIATLTELMRARFAPPAVVPHA